METHDFLDLDEFLADQEKEDRTHEQVAAETPLAPSQIEGLQKGAWAMLIDDNPTLPDAKLSCFYIFADQDMVVMSAVTGEDYNELVRDLDEAYSKNLRRGRRYSPDAPGGELTECAAQQLVPISEEQANEIRACEYRLPVALAMCDWLRPLLDDFKHELEQTEIAGLTSVICPKCGSEAIGLMLDYQTQGVFVAIRSTEKENTYVAGHKLQSSDKIRSVSHAHLVCGEENCDYDEHVDLEQYEIEH